MDLLFHCVQEVGMISLGKEKDICQEDGKGQIFYDGNIL